MRIAFVLAGLLLAPTAMAQCTGTPWLELRVLAAEPADGEPARAVTIDRDGCVEVRLPGWNLRPGTYVDRLGADEVAELQRAIDASDLRGFDVEATRADVAENERRIARGLDDRAPLFEVQCADVHELVLREDGSARRWRWSALDESAKRHPEVDALTRFAAFVARVDALARRVPTATEVAP